MSPPAAEAQGRGPQVSAKEYEGWRQYSVHCARCHGQDVLGNPVAPDLRKSTAPGGPVEKEPAFAAVVMEGRAGMPAFKGQVSPEQVSAIHAYVHGRAGDRIPPGRPRNPGSS
jgi:mono/diheme cytochrome c family protein